MKLPVHDLKGATGYVLVFGGAFDPKRAQAMVERFALMVSKRMVSEERLPKRRLVVDLLPRTRLPNAWRQKEK